MVADTDSALDEPIDVGSADAPSSGSADSEAALSAARAADAKGGERTVVLQVGEVLGITEHFVITSAGNPRLVRAIVDDVEAKVAAEYGLRPARIEGRDDLRWVLMDYGDWLVHVFVEEARDFYDLERLWADVPRISWAR